MQDNTCLLYKFNYKKIIKTYIHAVMQERYKFFVYYGKAGILKNNMILKNIELIPLYTLVCLTENYQKYIFYILTNLFLE